MASGNVKQKYTVLKNADGVNLINYSIEAFLTAMKLYFITVWRWLINPKFPGSLVW